MVNIFDKQDLRNISEVLSSNITHNKITEYLQDCNISESGGYNKSDRIYPSETKYTAPPCNHSW